MNTHTHHDLVDAQYAPHVQAYVHSAVHAQGPDLAVVPEWLRGESRGVALDLGCGGGHLSYLLAERVGMHKVVACDLSDAMLKAVAEEAQRRVLPQICVCRAVAESLPWADGHFDLVASRYSAHHWHDFERGVAETGRVLKPGGVALFIDVLSPGQPLLDTSLQTWELLRDPSHVRNATIAQWAAVLAAQGLRLERVQTVRVRLGFAAWIERMQTPPVQAQAVRALQQRAPASVRDWFELAEDGSFTVDTGVLLARKP